MSELDRHELETRMMDDLKSMGCNISVNTTFDGAFFVQITLLHGDQMCGHTGRNTNQHFNDATKGAIRNILRAASGSKCGVETKKLEELVS